MNSSILDAVETAPRERLTALQNERLAFQVRHAWDNIPYYRELMRKHGVQPNDIQTVGDLVKLPFLTKDDLRNNYPDGFLAVPKSAVVRIHATSGTTGKRVISYYTQNDLDMWENCCTRALVAAGGSRNDIVQVSCAYGLFAGGFGWHGGAQKLGAMVLPMSGGNTERQLEFMVDMRTTMLCCTATYAAHLAEMIEEKNLRSKICVKSAFIGAEPWTEAMREEIQRRSGMKVFDVYGLTEVIGPGIAYECSEQRGMHIQEDRFYPEIVDPETGKVLPDGETGELVLTALTKEAFPLIRYRTRDICTLTHEPCACGRTFVRMSKPKGRTDDMLIVKGENVFPSQIETVLIEQGMSSNYKIVLDRVRGLDRMKIQVEMLPETYTEDALVLAETEARIARALKTSIDVTAGIELLAPMTLERSAGKAHRIDDRRNVY
ncbi:MAG: phenylacetate--CoA ligase [Clostridia bacterium]|nr:phenylacetate--CoA ligase [Clostridia bacterium]